MSKEPAFLFYPSDFNAACLGLSMRERGQFITLLCMQHLYGHLNPKLMRKSVGALSAELLALFTADADGLLYNPRMETVSEKRKRYSEKQREISMRRWDKNRRDPEASSSSPSSPSSDFSPSCAENPSSSSLSPTPPPSQGMDADGCPKAMPLGNGIGVGIGDGNGNQEKTRDTEKAEREATDPDTVQGVRGSGREGAAEAEQNAPEIRSPRDEAFARFWAAYPRKLNRRKAREAFESVPPEVWPSLIPAIEAQWRGELWQKEHGRFIPSPAAWLSEERWADEPEIKSPIPPKPYHFLTPEELDRLIGPLSAADKGPRSGPALSLSRR